MSNRNFDSRVIIQRLQQQNYARNLYQNNTTGQRLINNPQNTDGNSSRFNSYVPGAQTDYFRGLVGAGETVSPGGIIGIPAILPTATAPAPAPLAPPAPIITLNSVTSLRIPSGFGGYRSDVTITYTSNEAYSNVYLQRRGPGINDSPLDNSGFASFNLLQGTHTLNLGETSLGIAGWYLNLNISSISFTTNIVLGIESTVLTAPTLVYAISSNNGAYIYFNAGTGSPTNYQYTLNSGSSYLTLNPSDIMSPVYIPNLQNGIQSNIELRAVNSAGFSSNSNSISVTPNNNTIQDPLLMFDPNSNSSYSGTGANVVSIGINTTLTGTKGASVLYQDDVAISRKIFNFSGSNGNANVITFPSFNFGTQISATAWIYPRSKNDINGLLVNTTANVAPSGFKFQWNWWQNNSRTIGMQAGNGITGADNYTITNTINYNEWQHIGYVFDQANRRIIIFKNGIPVDMMSSIEPVANIGTNQAFNIGGYINGTYTMNANLGYIKVFNTLLNASEVLSDFNNTKSQFGL